MTNYMWSGLVGLFLKMEQNNLYNEINFNVYYSPTIQGTTAPDNATAIRRTIDGFVCPSNRRPQTVNSGTGATTTSQLGPSDYRGNHGRRHDDPELQQRLLRRTPRILLACLYLRQRAHVSELHGQHGRHHRRIVQHDPHRREHLATRCLVAGNKRRRSDQHRPDHQPADQLRLERSFWTYWASKHPSAVNFGYCDGSVRPVTSQINKLVLNKLCTRNGGETISSDEMK